jgi:adenylate kinase family enzyme
MTHREVTRTCLGPRDDVVTALGRVPTRIAVAGVSGSGKTTLASRIGRRLRLPHTEIDGLHHGPGWTVRPEFMDDVRAFLAEPAWVTEWQYRGVRPLILERADIVVWLDLPTSVTMRQVARRTVRRRVHREVLWNGNVEPPLWKIFTAGDENIVRWAWSTRNSLAHLDERLAEAVPHVLVVRLRNRRDVDAWMERLPRAI